MRKFSIYDEGKKLLSDDARALADISHMSEVRTQYTTCICEDLWKYGEGIVWC